MRNVWSAALLQAKNEDRVKVYANVSGLGGVMDSGHAMEMRCALVLISLAASEGLFRISGFKSAGSTVVPSHLSPADLAITKKSYPSVVVVGLRLWESRMRFPSLGVFPQAAIAGH
jgi:hypothetical protein